MSPFTGSQWSEENGLLSVIIDYADDGLTGTHVSDGKCFQRIGFQEMALQSSLDQGKNGRPPL